MKRDKASSAPPKMAILTGTADSHSAKKPLAAGAEPARPAAATVPRGIRLWPSVRMPEGFEHPALAAAMRPLHHARGQWRPTKWLDRQTTSR